MNCLSPLKAAEQSGTGHIRGVVTINHLVCFRHPVYTNRFQLIYGINYPICLEANYLIAVTILNI